MARILIVEDLPTMRGFLEEILSRTEHTWETADGVSDARERLSRSSYDLVLCSAHLNGDQGVSLIRYITENRPDMAVVATCSKESSEVASKVSGLNVYGCIASSYSPIAAQMVIECALHRLSLERDRQRHRQELERMISAQTEEIKKQREEYAILIHTVPCVVYKGKKDWSIDFVSPRIKQLTGCSPDELVEGRARWNEWIVPEDLPRVKKTLKTALTHGGSFVREYRIRDVNGCIHWVQDRGQIVFDRRHNVERVYGVLFDITRQKEAEEALKRAHRQLDQLFSAITSILIAVDSHGHVHKWNHQAEKIFGFSSHQVLGRPLESLSIDWEIHKIMEAITMCEQRRSPQRLDEVRYTRTDGNPGILGFTISPMQLDDRDGHGFLLMGADITERKHLQNQLLQAQKLESLGQLAAGIAHEINTPIQFVGDNTRFLEEAFRDLLNYLDTVEQVLKKIQAGGDVSSELSALAELAESIDLEYLKEEIPPAISQALEGVDRVAKIVSAMKAFSHPGTDEKTAVDINAALENTLTVTRNTWKYVAEVVTDFDPELPPVECHYVEMNQVFLNIIVNAAQAIEEALRSRKETDPDAKGLITVSTRRVDGWCEIRISDTGCGIPESIRHRIFDPFFTTKEVGKGTGQGLAISHDVVVEKHGGQLTFETEENKGTTFIIRLPLHPSRS